MKALVFFVLLSLLSLSVKAQDLDIEKDTAAIERQLSNDIDKNPSTWGMNEAVEKATKAYDKLLNKYYQACLEKMKAIDKPILIAAQRAWISFRDKEIKLIETTIKDEYTGGGSIWSNMQFGSIFQLTKNRVVDLYNHYLVLIGLPI